MKKSIRCKAGDVLEIQLKDGSFGYGRVLKKPEVAFYNIRSFQTPSLNEIISRPILFRLFVQDEAIKGGSWRIIERVALSGKLLIPHPYFVWGPLQEAPFITYDGSERILATPEECRGLDRVIIWDPETAIQRLHDTLAGDHEKWIQNVEQEW